MMKNLQWRLGLIVVVIGLSVWAFVPPGQKVKLGLDLKGGVHLVLRVKTDDALKVETDTTVERLRDTVTRAGVAFSKIEATSPTEFRVDGIQDDAAFRAQAADVETVYDRSSETGRLFLSDEAERGQPASRRDRGAGTRDDRAARQRAGCRGTDRGTLRCAGSDSGAAPRRERRPPRQGHHPLDGAPGAAARRSGTVPESRSGIAGVQQHAARRFRGAAREE